MKTENIDRRQFLAGLGAASLLPCVTQATPSNEVQEITSFECQDDPFDMHGLVFRGDKLYVEVKDRDDKIRQSKPVTLKQSIDWYIACQEDGERFDGGYDNCSGLCRWFGMMKERL